MLKISGCVRMVALQFSFSNGKVVPRNIRQERDETERERKERKSRSTGIMMITPTDRCSLLKFIGDLEKEEYEMVDAFHKERIDPKDFRRRRRYHMVRFVFSHRRFLNVCDEFRRVRNTIYDDLVEMCRLAMWRVRVFSNPFYENGEEVPDQRAVSVNLESREPLYLPDGKPVVIWQKDEEDERVGDAPLPIEANHDLRIVSEDVQILLRNSSKCRKQ